MEYPVEKALSYPLLALFVLAVFYGIYSVKMLAQKRRGIRTRQIGQRKEKPMEDINFLNFDFKNRNMKKGVSIYA